MCVCVCLREPQSGSGVLGCQQQSDQSCSWTERWYGPSERSELGRLHQDGSSPPAHRSRSPANLQLVWVHKLTIVQWVNALWTPTKLKLTSKWLEVFWFKKRVKRTDLDLLDIFWHHFGHILPKFSQLFVNDSIFGPDSGCRKDR